MRKYLSAGRIAYYITPHGFGHAVRSLEVIRALLELNPRLDVVVVSDLPDFLIEQNVGRKLPLRRERIDIGIVQKSSVEMDLEGTLEALTRLRSGSPEIIERETRFLEEYDIELAVCDIPFLAFHAASRRSVPAIGLSNFTWDWIYGYYAATDERWVPFIDWIRDGYRKCGCFLRLPMHGDCSACPTIEDVPLVARKAAHSPEEIRDLLGCSRDAELYLVSFSDLSLDMDAQKRIERIPDAVFLYKQPLRFSFSNGLSLDDFDLTYVDAVAAVDAVITKPGYGIVSDCLAHGTPIIYTDRGPFAEYEILVETVERYLPNIFMPSKDLLEGSWTPYLDALRGAERKPSGMKSDGARVCANLILDRLSGPLGPGNGDANE